LAGARRSKQRQELAAGDIQGNIGQGPEGAEGLADSDRADSAGASALRHSQDYLPSVGEAKGSYGSPQTNRFRVLRKKYSPEPICWTVLSGPDGLRRRSQPAGRATSRERRRSPPARSSVPP